MQQNKAKSVKALLKTRQSKNNKSKPVIAKHNISATQRPVTHSVTTPSLQNKYIQIKIKNKTGETEKSISLNPESTKLGSCLVPNLLKDRKSKPEMNPQMITQESFFRLNNVSPFNAKTGYINEENITNTWADNDYSDTSP